MSLLDPQGAMKALEDGTVDAVKSYFPYEGKVNKLVATDVYVGKDADEDDVAGQKRARLRGRTWATGVYGDFKLVNKETGAVIDESKGVRLASLPKLTRRFSFIIDGKEQQADNQWRLKSGVYSRQRANGELEAQFNLAKGRGFRLEFAPEKSQFTMRYATTNVQLLPVLRGLGMSESELQNAFGDAVYKKLASGRQRGDDLQKLAKAVDPRYTGSTEQEAVATIKKQFDATELREDTTKLTLGRSYNKVTADALLTTAKKLININTGTDRVDNRDALQFKELWTIEDHIPERIINSKLRVTSKLRNNVDRKDKVADIVSNDIFNVPIKSFFTSTSITQQPNQNNPVDMLGGFLRTSILGTGAIGSEQAVTMDAKMIDPSTLGVIDPVHTPEGSRSGITLHLSVGVDKRGKDPIVAVYETKTGKTVYKSPAELATGTVGFSDQWEEEGGKLRPIKQVVTAVPKGGGDPMMVAPSEVDYILRTPKSMFSVTANLIPFLPSDQAGRAGMATRHMEQTVALKYREAPLVQVASGSKDERFDTFEKMYGRFSTQVAPVSGKVVAITPDEITIQGADKKKHVVGVYNNFPLNEKKSFLHSTPLVAVGDAVEEGDVISDNNFTKNGVLALGRNVRIGYMAFRGATFEDGIVVSESAAKKMTSEHMSKPRAYLDRGMQTGLAKFRAHFPGVITEQNAAKLDTDGVIKPGQVVEPGEVIMTVLKKTEPSPEQVMLRGIHKSLARPYKNDAVTWDSPYSGVVTDVVKNGNEIVAYVRTEEPLEVGDKLSYRHGNKGIVSAVLPDEEMPRNAEGEPLEVIVNFYGVPSRINVGQVLETMLAKAADKAGTTYAIDNFQPHGEKKIIQVRGHYRSVKDAEGNIKRIWINPHDREVGYHELVEEAMKKVGVSDTEELFDPATGKSFGKVLVGKQYCIKLLHQVDKKLAARSYGYGNDYDANLVPKGGGDSGAQRYGELGTYAMLAHGSLTNLRESLSWKSDKSQSDVWVALQAGEPLPAPKPTFAYEKFVAYLNAVGLNVEKEGNNLRLVPFTDEAIRQRSNGALKDPAKVLRGKDLKPEPGGLFDEKITGGPGGKLWSHIELAERVPNPIFSKAIMSLLGITGAQYDAIIAGDMTIGGKTGPAAIAAALEKIDVNKELAAEKEKLKTARKSALDGVYKRVKLLQALQNNRMTAKQAYTLSSIPVIPPVFRPVTVMEGGDLNIDGVNLLYRDLALLNEKLAEGEKVLPDSAVAPLKKGVYEAVASLISAGAKDPGLTSEGDIKPPGILSILSGSSPKYSYVHQKLLDRKQDLTMRSVITPDLTLGVDEIALPREGAFEVFKPFVVKELVTMGYTPLKAREEVEKRTPLANRALEVAVSKRPVMFKRDPVLHKFGILGFNVRLHDGKDIRIPPIVVGGFNADFDGDQQLGSVLVFVPAESLNVDFDGRGGYNTPYDFWKSREVRMTAQFKAQVGYVDEEGMYALVNLEDFPHGELLGTKGHISFYAVPPRVYVVANDEKTGAPTLAEVSAWSVHKDRKVEIVTLRSGRQIITDDDERAVYGIDAETLSWVRRRPSESTNLYVPVVGDLPTGNDPLLAVAHGDDTFRLSGSLGYFIGATVGDGWVSHFQDAPSAVNICSEHEEIISAWSLGAAEITGSRKVTRNFAPRTDISGHLGNSTGSHRATISCARILPFLVDCFGRGAANKHLPPFFYCAPVEFRKNLLAGLLDTDGCISWSSAKNKPQLMVSYCSTSFRLVQEIQTLLRTLGVASHITATASSTTGTPAWILSVSTPELRALGTLPLRHPGKCSNYAEFLSSDVTAQTGSYRRVVPVPRALVAEVRTLLGQTRDPSLYAILSKSVSTGECTRVAAQRALKLLADAGLRVAHPLFSAWEVLIRGALHFDKVAAYEVTQQEETGYDLTVPGFETFMSSDGIILSNTMSVFVPVSQQAIDEVNKMKPSANMFNLTTGAAMYQVGNEAQLGVFLLTQPGKDTTKSFPSLDALITAAKDGKIGFNEFASVGRVRTTAGRGVVYQAFPDEVRTDEMLTDKNIVFNNSTLQAMLRKTAKTSPNKYAATVDNLKRIGFGHAHDTGFSFSSNDFRALKDIRESVLKDAHKKAAAVRSMNISDAEKEKRVVQVYTDATKEMSAKAKSSLDASGSNLYMLNKAGVKPGWGQVQQMVLAPMLLDNAAGRTIPSPVTRSYSEGLDSAGYWVASSGARKGVVEKVQSVQVPGALSKQIVNTVIPYSVSTDDCGTSRGISLDVSDSELSDRFLAKDVIVGNTTVKAGTLLTPNVLDKLKQNKVAKVLVRSPMKCQAKQGLCSKCYGVDDGGKPIAVGTNIGILAGQSIGERGTQLSLKSFHTGGLAGSGSKVTSSLDRVISLLKMPETLPNSATLAGAGGKVQAVTKNPLGGYDVKVGDISHYVPGGRELKVEIGSQVEKGDPLTDGPINPRELMALTSLAQTQNYMADVLYDAYKGEGIKRRNAEVVIKSVTNLGVVDDPGDSDEFIRGDPVALSYIEAVNKDKSPENQVKVTPVLRGLETLPLDRSTDWGARLQYRHLQDTFRRGASEGWKSDIHGMSPVPGIIYTAELGKKPEGSGSPY